ncbi:hypothetical protein QJQ45_025120 [Haematococcus lacustris]|nr:hypothetical protein QJQ45_025120 [Haematococcus lacustris]
MSAKPKNTSHVGGQPPGKPFGLAAHSSGHEHSIAPVGGFIRAEMNKRTWCAMTARCLGPSGRTGLHQMARARARGLRRVDLANAVELLRRIRGENVELKRNFESMMVRVKGFWLHTATQLKGLHLHLGESHQQLQSKYAALQEERVTHPAQVNVERQYQALCESWRVELEDKQRSFEAARAQIIGPRDIELIKIKLMEEVEGPYKLKCDLLGKEAEAAQQNYVQLRREHEQLSAAHKNLVGVCQHTLSHPRHLELRSQTEMEHLVADHTALVSQLRDKIAELGLPQGQSAKSLNPLGPLGQASTCNAPAARIATLETALRNAERERDAALYTAARAAEEIAEVRRLKERASVEREAASAKVERKVKDIQAEELKLSGLVESLSRKNRHLQKELAETHRSNEEMFGQLLKARGDVSSLQEQLEAVRKATAAEAQASSTQYEAATRRLEETVDRLRDELHGRERQIAELHLSYQEQVSRLTEAHEARLAEEESSASSKLREAREVRVELQAKVDALKDACEGNRRECEDFKRKETSRAEQSLREVERLQVDSWQAVAGAEARGGSISTVSYPINNSTITNWNLAQAAEAERQAAAKTADAHQLKVELDKLQARGRAEECLDLELPSAEIGSCGMRVDANRLELSNGHLSRRKEELEAQVERMQAELRDVTTARLAITKEVDEGRRALAAEKGAHLEHMHEARQAAAAEKAALAKKYQATLREVTTQHEAEVKRLRRKHRALTLEVAALTDQVSELRLHNHELEAVNLATTVGNASLLRTTSALRGSGAAHPGALTHNGAMTALRASQETLATLRGLSSDVSALRDVSTARTETRKFGDGSFGLVGTSTGVLADLEALKVRQQGYLNASRDSGDRT